MKHPIRKILVPLDPSDYAHAATIQACRIARAHEAAVAGLTVLDSPEIRASIIPSQYGYMELAEEAIEIHKKSAQANLAQAEQRFEKYCYDQKVEALDAAQEGYPATLVLEAATLFDLMVVGLRTYFHFETRDGDGEVLTKILTHTSTPVLAVPQKDTIIQNVLVAYDGSVASARALRDFVLFAEPLKLNVDLFLASKDKGRLDFHANKAKLYLEDHGVKVNEVIGRPMSALEALEDGVTDNYDLIVCGMHSKRVIKDFFVGSFVTRLIEKEDKALFLSH